MIMETTRSACTQTSKGDNLIMPMLKDFANRLSNVVFALFTNLAPTITVWSQVFTFVIGSILKI
jgi:hypothetical protein